MFERRSIRQKKPAQEPSIKPSVLYNSMEEKVTLCCICGTKCNDSVIIREKILNFTDTLNDLYEKEDIPEDIIASESRACTQCHNLLIKILQLLEEVKKQKGKLKHILTNRNRQKSNANVSDSTSDRLNKGDKICNQKRVFDCEVCGKEFTRKASLLEHAARHKGIRDRECKICKKKFYSTSYWRHMSTVHASETKLLHQCSKCDRKFAQKYRRALHEKSHVSYDEREFVCEKCPEEKRFATKNRYKTHMKQVHENEDEMSAKQIGGKLCPECGLIFSTNASYNIHRRKQHVLSDNPRKEECSLCYANFSTIEELQNHIRDAHEWCGLQCSSERGCQHSVMPKVFKNSFVMPNAETIGHEEVVVQPDFDSAGLLQESEVSHHPHGLLSVEDSQSGTLIISNVAAVEDGSTSQLMLLPTDDATNSLLIPGYDVTPFENSHLVDTADNSTHNPTTSVVPTSKSNYIETQCNECDKNFPTFKARNQHERLVHAKGPGSGVACTVCDRKFANTQYLRDHMRIHSDLKPFACDYQDCGKCFRLSKDLVRHKRVHTGEKPFKCDFCGKCFAASSNLSEHRTLHTGVMPYQCSHCKKHFRLWSTLRRHVTRCSKKNNTISSTSTNAAVLVFDLPKMPYGSVAAAAAT